MEILQTAAPHPQLAAFVLSFAHREISPGSSAVIQPVIASLEQTLTFELGDRPVMNFASGRTIVSPRVYLIGARTTYQGANCLGRNLSEFGIFFRPFASWQLFGIPPAELAERDGDATGVMGPWVVELWHKLADCRSFSDRTLVATETLLPFAEAARPLTPIMYTVHRLLPSDEPVRIARIARGSSMSIRSYERQFTGEIGISPKKFARLARFARAIDMKRIGEDSWLNICHDLGYFDQMHMIRDFRSFGGDTPGRLVHTSSDIQPWSVQAPQRVDELGTAVATSL
jgi:AraC-like DNA-binding protein